MTKYLFGIVMSLAVASSLSFAAPKIAGTLQFVSPTTNKAVKSARVGKDVKIKISVKNLNLIANKDVTLVYALSVLPKGSKTPTTISGKLSGKFTLPKSEGGAAQTKSELASWVGTKKGSEILTIPDFMPAGVATVTISLAAKGKGSFSLSKTLKIRL